MLPFLAPHLGRTQKAIATGVGSPAPVAARIAALTIAAEQEIPLLTSVDWSDEQLRRHALYYLVANAAEMAAAGTAEGVLERLREGDEHRPQREPTTTGEEVSSP
jgi:hypothetical protein